MVGALRCPMRPAMPVETGFAVGEGAQWIVAVAAGIVPSADRRPSKNKRWPSAIFSAVCGLSAGIAALIAAGGRPTCRIDLD